MSVTPRGIPSETLCDSFIRVVFNNETSNYINARIELRMILLYKPSRDHCMYANRNLHLRGEHCIHYKHIR